MLPHAPHKLLENEAEHLPEPLVLLLSAVPVLADAMTMRHTLSLPAHVRPPLSSTGPSAKET